MIDDKEATQILMSNLKGSKTKSVGVLKLAESAYVVSKKMTQNDMRDLFDVSNTMLGRIKKIYELDKTAKEIIERKKFGIEQSYLLCSFKPKDQKQIAELLSDLNIHESRRFIQLLKKNPNTDPVKIRKQFEEMIQNKFSLLVVPMRESLYSKLSGIAKNEKTDPHALASTILEAYVNDKK